MIVALMILRFDTTSITTIGVLVGVVVIAAGINEFILASLIDDGWRWLHAIAGVLFVIVGVVALFSPGDTFWLLAALIGWFLLFKGAFDIIAAFASKAINDLWWITLVIGIAEVLLAFWAAGGFGRKAVLLVIWAAAAALGRGITEIITAFGLRKLGEDAMDDTLPPGAPGVAMGRSPVVV
jgi:uncharacterized membrane protein HdeD (DUF308 family)